MVKYKMAPVKRPVTVRGSLMILNIKLLHNQCPENYVKLFNDLLERGFVVKLMGEHHIELISFFKLENCNMYQGNIVTYMGIRPEAWFNQKSKELEVHDLGKDLYANTKKGTFYLIPENHRVCLFANSKVDIVQLKKFIDSACIRLLGEKQVHTVIETSEDCIKAIFEADEVSRVKISLSYSNKAFTKGFAKVLDEKAKEANLSDINFDIQSAKGESLNMEEDGLVASALELVPSNGYAEAVVNVSAPNGKKKKRKVIKTSQYKRKEPIKCQLNELNDTIYTKIITIFKVEK